MKQAALIVGASGKIGSAVTTRLAAAGWRCYRSTSDASRGDYDFLIDFTHPEEIAQRLRSLPLIDGAIICSGMEPQQSLEELSQHHLKTMFDIHVLGPIMLLKAIESKLADNSTLVLVSSAAAFTGSYDPSYAAAKGAVVSLTRTLARTWAPRVRVNAIAPSLVTDTPVYHRMTEDFRERHEQLSLLGRLGTTNDCAEAIEFLLTHRHLTGVILHMNGGQYFG